MLPGYSPGELKCEADGMPEVLCPVMVGRVDERHILESAFAGAQSGAGGVVFVTGEAGVGKSRLAREALEAARQLGMLVVAARAVPVGASTPYLPLAEAVLQAIRHRPLAADPDLDPWLPMLGSMIPAISTTRHSATSRVLRGEALLRLLRWLSSPEGLVVLLEDLHWADPDTVAVLEYLGDNLATEAVLIVVTCRSDSPSDALDLSRRSRGRTGVLQVRLDRLADGDVARMVEACQPGAGDEAVARVVRTAEGVPFLVEEVLASPGVPSSFNDSVQGRLASFSEDERAVLDAAALLGREFDWQLLPASTGQSERSVAGCLEHAVSAQLLAVADGRFRFRHALTREAVLERVLPPRRRELATAALAAVEAGRLDMRGAGRDLAAELAVHAGDHERAGELLVSSGRQSLERGALATATGTLRRARELLAGRAGAIVAEALLIDALALAGRVDEANAVGGTLIRDLETAGVLAESRADIHVRLAQALVAASRWNDASAHLAAARGLLNDPEPWITSRAGVLEAEVAFAAGDVSSARRLARAVLASGRARPEVRCHALEIVGRSERLGDLDAARMAFEQERATAEASDLGMWRLRALHELGTIDMFDHAGVDRLLEAHGAAKELGALSTVAVLDLQLGAMSMCRFAVDDLESHAREALGVSQRLALTEVRAQALILLQEAAAMRHDRTELASAAALSKAASGSDARVEAFRLGAEGLYALIGDDVPEAVALMGRATAILAGLPPVEPAAFRALWPLLLAAEGDGRAQAEIKRAGELGVAALRMNRGLLGYAEAVLAGRAGETQRAIELADSADRDFENCEVWGHVARLCAARPALAGQWGRPDLWLADARVVFERVGLEQLARRCGRLARRDRAGERHALGFTARETEVLSLVAEGLANKEIATRLGVSPRTVEKHVESLLRKTGARSRTRLVHLVGSGDAT